jgi:primosomal protein N' (replication factor Y)
MVVEIIPFIHLPRQLVSFSYAVPENLMSSMKVGLCVRIPWRKSTVFGLIIEINNKSTLNLKSVQDTVHSEPLLDEKYINHLYQIGQFYGVSIATVLLSALPPLQIKKTGDMAITPWRIYSREQQKPNYHWYTTEEEQKNAYRAYEKENCAIIVPTNSNLAQIKTILAELRPEGLYSWSSELSIKMQRETWFAIRNGECKTLVATRSALWLPLHQSFDRILLEMEHSSHHKQWDQSPRFHAKDLAKLMCKHSGMHYTEMSYSPSVTSWYFSEQGHYNTTTSNQKISPPLVIQQAAPTKKEKIYTGTLAHIEDNLKVNSDVVILHNRTGSARQLFCRDCSFVAKCVSCSFPLIYHQKDNLLHCHYCGVTQPTIITCPQCNGVNLSYSGFGIEGITQELKKNIPDTVVLPIAAETVLPTATDDKPRILVGTDALLQKLDWSRVSLMVVTDTDEQLRFPEYEAEESVWHRLHEIAFRLQNVPYIVQTQQPEHKIFTHFLNPKLWYSHELTIRASLEYPPFSYLIRYLIGDSEKKRVQIRASHVAKTLEHQLTKLQKKVTIQGPISTEPERARGSNWCMLMLKINESDILGTGLLINRLITEKVKIDPHPTTVLNPF